MEEKALIPQETFQIMDRLDDELIEQELKGRVATTWSYSFKDGSGRLQEGLSKIGVDEACVEMSRRNYIIREGRITWDKDPTDAEYILFQAPASLVRITPEGQEIILDTVNGTKRQWIKMKTKTGSIIADNFWFEKGAMKAGRNARSRLIPAEVKTKILVLARQSGKEKPIPSSGGQNASTVKDTKKDNARPSQKKDKFTEAFLVSVERIKEELVLSLGEAEAAKAIDSALNRYEAKTFEEVKKAEHGAFINHLGSFNKS